MGEAVPALEIFLSGVQTDCEGIVVEFGAEDILDPGKDGVGGGEVFGRVIHQLADPFEGRKSSGFGTGSIYMVMPCRPRATARSMKGLASAASRRKFEILASTQISGPKWRRSRCGRISPIRRRNSCSPVVPLALFQRYLTVPSNTP